MPEHFKLILIKIAFIPEITAKTKIHHINLKVLDKIRLTIISGKLL
jgi:hypothetical protein